MRSGGLQGDGRNSPGLAHLLKRSASTSMGVTGEDTAQSCRFPGGDQYIRIVGAYLANMGEQGGIDAKRGYGWVWVRQLHGGGNGERR